MAHTFAPEAGGLEIFDTTLRDGDQAQPYENQFPEGTKPDAADRIAQLGVDTIEAGFATTPSDFDQVRAVADTVGKTVYTVTPRYFADNTMTAGEPYRHTPVITGLSRATEGDIENTWAAVQGAERPGIHTFIATAPNHIATKFPGKTPEEIVIAAGRAVRFAREISDGRAKVEFSAEAASTTPLGYLEAVVKEAMQNGADVINLPDTLGAGTPKRIRNLFAAVTRWVVSEGQQDNVTISTHCHNDWGMATAHSMIALQTVAETARDMGARSPSVQFEGVVGGRGERAGNASLEQQIMAVLLNAEEFEGLRMPRIDTTRIVPVAQHIFKVLGMEIPPTAPIIGIDTLTHRSGIHADAIVKGGASLYTPHDPRWVGHDAAAIIAPGGYQGTRGNNNLGPMHMY